MSNCKKCDCHKKKKDTKKECKKNDSCLKVAEIKKLHTKHTRGGYAKGSSGNNKYMNRLYLEDYAKLLYGKSKKNKKRASCARKRKCILRPYSETKGDGACCPGMTGHHVVPESALKNLPTGCYDHDAALTVCASGATNHKGLHGYFHVKLRERIKKIRKKADRPNKIELKQMVDESVGAFEDIMKGICDIECIKTAINENLKKRKNKNNKKCPEGINDKTKVDAKWGSASGEGTKNAESGDKIAATFGV